MIPRTIEVEIRRVMPASRQRVFDAWKEPEFLRHWWGSWGNYAFARATVDFRVGGRYEFSMSVRNKDIIRTSYGEYLEIIDPERLIFTWSWTHDETPMNSLITLDFRELGPSETELVLRHERIPDTEEGRKHEEGWKVVVGRLGDYLAQDQQ